MCKQEKNAKKVKKKFKNICIYQKNVVPLHRHLKQGMT